MKEEIDINFIQKGEQRDGIQFHEAFNIDGNHQQVPVIGILGGMLG